MRIAVLASGTGSNLKILLEHAAAGRLAVTPALVLSNNPKAGALAHAQAHGVPVWREDSRGERREDFDARMLKAIDKSGAEAIILAGYMRLLSGFFIQAFAGRILNIHPAILPSFIGVAGGQDALDYQARLSGCTVHFVEEAPDSGPVIIQAAVPVSPHDSLADLMPRIHALEHRIYPQAVQWMAQGRLKVEGRKVILLPRTGRNNTAEGTVRPSLGLAGDSPLGPWLVSPALEDF
ncbi:MAG: phosphoribosylglycinamide formyltransferase [Deltaproteobacteria bacterium]|jgi:phosphoribosylglycinamide formyltransferase-1|nr:phosphoribosylglycinamide formyltransferase [Deltaproteobacteria bacterium]